MKKNIKLILSLVSVLGVLSLYQNCSNSMSPLNLDGSSVDDASLTGAQLESRALSILNNKCASCHLAPQAMGGIDYINDVDSLRYYQLVYPGEAALSPLYTTLNNHSQHLSLLSGSEVQVVYNWIQSLATDPGGITPPAPQPLTPTFASIQSRILGPRCSSCHNATVRNGGVNLSTLAGVLATVVAGNPNSSRLYTEVQTNQMPVAPATPLTTEEKNAIRDWIANGAQNN